eukprot:7672009-Ditylum_brightwellii.AAC.1
MHIDIFEDASPVLNKFTTKSCLKEILHGSSSQRNEGTNNNTNTKAPKIRVYSSISSLQDRVATMVGEHNIGHTNYYALLFAMVGIYLLPSISFFLQRHQGRKQQN